MSGQPDDPRRSPSDARLTLAEVPRGGKARIRRLSGRDSIVQRLLEMGLTEGAEVSVVRFAPLGDPVEVRIRGYALSLRRDDARCVEVTPA